MARTRLSGQLKQVVHKHPLQKLDSPSRGVSALVHVVGLSSFAGSFLYLSNHPNPINTAYGWHFQYLTIIGLSLAALTCAVGLIADLTDSRILFRAKNVLSITSLPMAVLISTLYWSLRAIDPSLVVPPEFELPLEVDLGFHAVPAIILLLDLLFLSPPWTITVVPALILSTSIAFGYWFWIELCYSKNGFYPYPIFALLNTTQRVGLFGASAVVMAGLTGLLSVIYARVNGVEHTKQEKVSNMSGRPMR